ncbi:MAG TPA: zf-HC2 domain-containing protein [Vicinamibacteria bacterium]|nr:zf-HC2 domain-containing protein [Vicinamibacteria bacterium]
MGEKRIHPKDALQDALDGRLVPHERAELDEHLASCSDCRRELEALRWTKAQAASGSVELPPDLETSLRAAFDEEDRASARRSPLPRAVSWIAAAAALVAAIWFAARLLTPSIPELVAAEVEAYASNDMDFEIRSRNVSELESFFVQREMPFKVTVYDLGMMDYGLEAGAVRSLGGRTGSLVAYRSADGRVLLCRMYLGHVSELPAPSEQRTNEGITFYLYRDQGTTLVFWQEGAMVCVLAGDADTETIVQLAFAKAVRV